jgi:cellulose synthase operon protein C
MLKVECEACKAPYQVDERRVPPTGLKMRCPKCGHSFVVAHPNAPAAASPKPALPAGPPRPAPKKMTLMGVGTDFGAPLPEQGATSAGGNLPSDDPFGDLPAAKPVGPALGSPPRPGVRRPLASPGAAPTQGDLDESEELSDLPAVLEGAGLPSISARPAAPRPPPPRASPAKPQPPSLSDFDIELSSVESDLPSAKSAARIKPDFTFDVDLPSPTVDLPSAKAGGTQGGRREHADLPAVAASLPSSKTTTAFGEIDLPVLGDNLPAMPARDHNLPATTTIGLPLPVVGAGLPIPVSAGLPSALGGSHLPSVSNALPTVANALPQLANQLPAPAHNDRYLPSAKDAMDADFGDLELKSLPPAEPDDLVEDLELPPPRDEKETHAAGGVGFGEVDLGDDSGGVVDAMVTEGVGPPSGGDKAGGGEAALPTAPAPAKRRERKVGESAKRSRTPTLLLGLAALTVVGGTLMQLTPYGAFGYVLIDDLLHESGWSRLAEEASQKTRLAAAPDIFGATEKALDELAAAHAESPRSKPLAAYAALAEYEGQLRFGKDGTRAARAQSWLAEIAAKGSGDVRYFPVATAAQAANNGDFPNARTALDLAAKKDAPGDPIQQDIALVRGEVELAAGDAVAAVAAVAAFTRALQIAPNARAHFGLARAYVLGDDATKARAEIAATLAASAHHVGARVLRATLTWANDKNEAGAMGDLHEVFEGSAKSSASSGDLSRAYALLGWIQSARGKTAEAHNSFDAAIKLDPRNADALIGQGEALFTEGRYTEALSRFDTAVQVEPRNVRAIVADAKAKISLERLGDAKTQLTQARTIFPNEMKVAFWLGKVEAALGNKKAAEDGFIAAIALTSPTRADAIEPYVALAEMLAAEGRAVEAEAKLSEAKGKLQDSAAMQRALGEVAAVQGQYDEAITHYQAAVEKDHDDLSSRFLLGVTYRRMQRIDAASAEFDKVFAVDKDYPGLSMERGLLFEQSGQIEKALEQFTAALQKAPDDVDLQLRVGAALVGVRHPDEAIVILKKVMSKRSTSAEANHYFGRAYFQKGGSYLTEAMRYLKRAVELDPNRAEYHFYLAWVSTELSPADLGTARSEVEKALAIDKLLGDAYWQRGVVERINSSVDDAIRDLKHALELRPTRFEAHATLAECYEDKNDYTDAAAEWSKAIANDDQRPFWRWRYGRLLFDKGNVKDAFRHLKFATNAAEKEEAWPGWATDAEFKVAEAYRRMKDTAEAKDHYNLFLDHAPPTHPDRRDAMNALASLGAPRDH